MKSDTHGETEARIEEIAEAIFEAIADPIFVIDFVGDDIGPRFRYVNEAACRLLGRPREELEKLRPGTVDDLPQSARDEIYECLVRDGRATFETLMIAGDGSRIPMELHASDTVLAGQRVCIAVARSLVARKEMDRRLREAKEAAEAANRAKSEFLATMSHEIRTPLHGVIGFASLLENAGATEGAREALDGIRDSATLLLALVNDVLDVSRIEAGQVELQARPLDPTALLRRIVAAFRLRAEDKGLAFSYRETTPLPAAVRADAVRIEQILGNLLGNALKFTERGEITLEAGARRVDGTDESEISLAVRDTGIGIRPDQLGRLFQRFSQVDASATRSHGGSGLGLLIVKRLCELMGGTATVQSEFGHGSTFTATLRVQEARPEDIHAAEEAPSERPAPAQTHRILAAEDNAVNRRLMHRMMEKLGHSVTFATSGGEACERARAEPCDIIFMDVSMPGVSGLEATRRIRAEEHATGRPRSWIIALTAGVSAAERRACAAAGMDDFLGKPFTVEGVRAAIARARLG